MNCALLWLKQLQTTSFVLILKIKVYATVIQVRTDKRQVI